MKIKIVFLLCLSLFSIALYAEDPSPEPPFPEFDKEIYPNDGGTSTFKGLNRTLTESYALYNGTFSFYDSTIEIDEGIDIGLVNESEEANSTIKLNNTSVFADGSTFYVKGNKVYLNLSENSIFVIDKIQTYNLAPEDQQNNSTGSPARLTIEVMDSSLFTNEIKIVAYDYSLKESDSSLSLVFANSSEESKNSNTSTISGKADSDYAGEQTAIGAYKFDRLQLTNYVLKIDGDIILGDPYSENPSVQTIERFELNNSDVEFGGETISGIGVLQLVAGSTFLITNPNAEITFWGAGEAETIGTISMRDSNFNVIDGEGVNNGNIFWEGGGNFHIALTNSVFYIDSIVYKFNMPTSTDRNSITIDAKVESEVDIETIDITDKTIESDEIYEPYFFNSEATSIVEKNFYLEIYGDSSSYINIDSILINTYQDPLQDEVWTTIDLSGMYGDIGIIQVNDDSLVIETKYSKDINSDIKIETIDFNPDTLNATLYLNSITLNINELTVNPTETFTLEMDNVNANFTTISVTSDSVNFNGQDDGESNPENEIVNINHFNNDATDSSTSNNFNHIRVNVGDYHSAGTINLTDADVFIKELSGDYTTFNVSEDSLFYIGKDSSFSLEEANIDTDSILIINTDDAFKNEDISINNSGYFILNGTDTFALLNNEANSLALLNGEVTVETINNDGLLYLSNGATVENLTNSNDIAITGDVYVTELTLEDNSTQVKSGLSMDEALEGNSLNFIILDNLDDDSEYGELPNSTLHIDGSITGLKNTKINIWFQHSSIFLPGIENYFTLITNDSGALVKLDEDKEAQLKQSFEDCINNHDVTFCQTKIKAKLKGKAKSNAYVYPPWLYYSVGISNNNAEGEGPSEDTSLGYWSKLATVEEDDETQLSNKDEGNKDGEEEGNTDKEEGDKEEGKHWHLNYDFSEGADNSKLGTNEGGQSIWINVQRLTNFKKLIMANGNPYATDQSLINIATTIDSVVLSDGDTPEGLNDIINSLDFNSGCGSSDGIIYENHNNPNPGEGLDIVDVSDAPCVITMSQNMETLKPINNEILMLSSHTIVAQSLYNMVSVNRSYNKVGEVKIWGTNSLNADYAKDKNFVTGYSSYGDNLQFGATTSLLQNFNLTSAVAFNVNQLNGNHDLYDSGILGFSYGLAASYVSSYYYVSISGLMSKNIYINDRNMDFLNNSYVNNSSVVSNSNTSVNEIIASIEIGTELVVLADTFLVPKIFISEGLISNANYSESGSSGDLEVQSFSTPITEIGIGIDIYRELLLPELFGQKNAFWYPKANISLVDRIYKSTKLDTDFNFEGTDEKYRTTSYAAEYSGLLTKVSGGLEYNKKNVTISVIYDLDIGFAGYINSTLSALFKYTL